MTDKEQLISRINRLSDEEISFLLDTVTLMSSKNTTAAVPDCPYCGAHAAIRYGHKCWKQRFLCKSCGRTFVQTTHTVMANSHFTAKAWEEVIKDTFHGNAIDLLRKESAAPTRQFLA